MTKILDRDTTAAIIAQFKTNGGFVNKLPEKRRKGVAKAQPLRLFANSNIIQY